MPVLFNGSRMSSPYSARWENLNYLPRRHDHIRCQCRGCNCALTGYEEFAYCEKCQLYCREIPTERGLARYRHTNHELCGNSAEILLRELAE